MKTFFQQIFSPEFMPHGNCMLWRPEVVWLHVASDVLIGLAYFSIPISLFVFVRKRRDLAFHWMFLMFGAFIFACGTTHVMQVVTMWNAAYGWEGIIKALTGVVSVATAIALWPMIPKAVALPSPADMAASNERLQAEIIERERVEGDLRAAQTKLREEVEARTRDLAEANRGLQARVQELHRAEERFRLAVEAAPTGMIMVDAAGRIILANSRIEECFGYSESELLGSSVDLLVPINTRDAHQSYRNAYAEHPTARMMGARQELFGLRKDGREIPVEIALNPLTVEHKPFVLASVIDITDRKRAETELRLKSTALEQSNRDLQQFAYAASHDLKEPLRQVANFAGLLAQRYGDSFDERGERYLHHVVEGAGRMHQLIEALLDYSRAGRKALSIEAVDVEGVLQEVLEDLGTVIGESNAEIATEAAVVVNAHPVLLADILRNLLGNAIKFRREEPPRIRITAQQQDDAWLFAVEDNGIGIAADQADRVFVIFQRLHTRDKYPGTGIGLALCKKLVELHGGKIWLKSTPEEGSTFYFTIPNPQDSVVEAG